MAGATAERQVLSRELSVFLVQLSIALHKNSAYPEGHPLLASAVEAVTFRLTALLHDRPSIHIGIARNQLVIDGAATDPANPVLRELAQKLHRQQLGAIKFTQGAPQPEIANVLRLLVSDTGRGGEPLGLRPAEELQQWPHVRLFPQAYDQLELAGEDGAMTGRLEEAGVSRGGRLWLGLATAALSEQMDLGSSPADPKDIAKAINTHKRDVTYDKAIIGYLIQLGRELKMSHGAEAVALQQRLSDMLRELNQDALQRLVELGGDLAQRQELLGDAAQTMPVRTVLELLKAVAAASEQSLSHSLLRLLTKLAAHSDQGLPAVRADADSALRDTVRQLIDDWTLDDPNPAGYTRALERLTRRPATDSSAEDTVGSEAPRIIQMSLEIGVFVDAVWRCVDEMVEQGMVGDLLRLLADPSVPPLTAEAFWMHLATPGCIRKLLMDESKEVEAVDRIIDRMGIAAAEPMLDALELADSRTSRRRLLTRLGKLGPEIGPLAVERLPEAPWFVQRNILALLGTMPVWPRQFTPVPYAAHRDSRVRREAVKMMLRVPDLKDSAVASGLADEDDQIVRMALASAQEQCPPSAVPKLMYLLQDRRRDAELRAQAIRVLLAVRTPATRDWLLRQAASRRGLFRRYKLAPKSPELIAVLQVLARNWAQVPAVGEVLRLAAKSGDSEIRVAATITAETP